MGHTAFLVVLLAQRVCVVFASNCAAGSYESDPGTCSSCPTGSTSAPGSTALWQCECSPGLAGSNSAGDGSRAGFTKKSIDQIPGQPSEWISTTAFMGAVLAENDILYFVPNGATYVGRYDPILDVVTRIDVTEPIQQLIDMYGNLSTEATRVGVNSAEWGNRWQGRIQGYNQFGFNKFSMGILAPNGKIYFVPQWASVFAVLDTLTDTFSVILQRYRLFRSITCYAGVLAPNGNVYMTADRIDRGIFVINTTSHNIATINIPSFQGFECSTTWAQVMSNVLGNDGKIYLIPGRLRMIMVLDPKTNTVSIAADLRAYLPDCSKIWFRSALRVETGIIYLGPNQAEFIGIFNPATGIFSTINIRSQFSNDFERKYLQILLYNSQSIVFVPDHLQQFAVLDLDNPTSSGFTKLPYYTAASPSENRFNNGIMWRDKLYLAPGATNFIGVLDIDNAVRTCTSCLPGTYSGHVASYQCSLCQGGVTSTMGAFRCDDCLLAWEEWDKASGTCERTACEPGSYLAQDSGACELCDAGKYKEDIDADECADCARGKYSSAVGAVSDVCQECLIDTKSYDLGATSIDTCVLCQNNKVSVAGSAWCSNCDYGKYKHDYVCMQCVVGHFCKQGLATACHADAQTVPAD